MESPKTDAQAHPTSEELNDALNVTVYDREGKTTTLKDLTRDKRSVLIFTRHYCAYPKCSTYLPLTHSRVFELSSLRPRNQSVNSTIETTAGHSKYVISLPRDTF